MQGKRSHITIISALAAAGTLGCAVSEPIDPSQIGHNGSATGLGGSDVAGTSGSGSAGAGGSAVTAGTAGTSGSAGATGAGATGSKTTSGSVGIGGDTGSAGAGGDAGSGQAGSGGGSGASGTAGRGGTIGGTIGSAGRGGSNGSGGRGGATGSGGRGGTAGTAGSPDAGTGVDAAATVTFTDIYTNILVVYCSGSSCHNPGAQKGIGFASQSAAYTAVRSRVTPGNGAGSSFFNTVNTGAMPRGAAKLSAANLAKIKAWIDAGALNN